MTYKLLIAEDNPLDRRFLRDTLDRHFSGSVTIYEAKNGTEALSLFHAENPHTAILNIDMDGINGLAVAAAIRESSFPCSIIFLTGSDNIHDARQAISLRALDYLVKPVGEEKLRSLAEEALRPAGWHADPFRVFPIPPNETPEVIRRSLVREDILSFIDAHYMQELSMKNVAHAMNYSDAYFCKLFKQCFQTNFSAYLNAYRISKAKDMMHNPRISIKDISTACGYTDSNYFTRVFKRSTGQTPSEYRLSMIKNTLRK